MRSPRPKIHLIDVAEPLLCFCRLLCRCGQEIRNAEMVFGIGMDECAPFTFPIRTCRECLTKSPQGDDRRRYVYGLIEAEEALHMEAEAS